MPQKRETFLIEIQNYFECDLEPQKGVPHCGSLVGPAEIPREREGVGLKILSAGRDSHRENAFPQNSRNSRTVKILSH
jgi:hypothetical protein